MAIRLLYYGLEEADWPFGHLTTLCKRKPKGVNQWIGRENESSKDKRNLKLATKQNDLLNTGYKEGDFERQTKKIWA